MAGHPASPSYGATSCRI